MGRRIFSDRGGRNETPRNLSGCGAWGVGVCGALGDAAVNYDVAHSSMKSTFTCRWKASCNEM